MSLVTHLRRWWHGHSPQAEPPAPYEVTCSCGRSLHGQRKSRHQVVVCPGCGQKRFILPRSPWPGGETSPARSPIPSHASRASLWRLVVVIVMGGVAAMGGLFLIVKPYLKRPAKPSAEALPGADIRARIAAGQRALAEGNFRLALKELDAAVEQRDRHPDLLSRAEHRNLDQLRRQSDLLALLLNDSLEEILQQALQHRNDDEWREKFRDYRGRTVLFDDVLRRDSVGRPALGFYVVRAGEVEARVALEDLQLLRQLPLDPPRRWLFGARLASCRREDGGVWVIRFEADSGVLLTDEGATAACCPGPVDEELREMLRRQAALIAGGR